VLISLWNKAGPAGWAALAVSALFTMPVSVQATTCTEELGELLGELARAHWSGVVRAAAGDAGKSVETVCNGSPTVLRAAGRLVEGLGDPAVRVLGASHFARTIEEWTGAPLDGVGLSEVLSVDIDEQTGRLTVIAPVPHSPAAAAGLAAGDVLHTIDGEATAALGLTASVERLRIDAGESLRLGVMRDDREREISLTARPLPVLEPVSVERRRLGGLDALHLRLHQFIPGAGLRLREAVESAGDVDIVLLDLRDNPGGLVTELEDVAGVFLEAGTTIAAIKGPDPGAFVVAEGARPIDTPLAVIVGPGSASAAEALAGALQAHGRARLYGQRTFGKGLVHQTRPMSDGAMLMFPGGVLETPAGRPILGHGILPDLRTMNPLTDAASDFSGVRASAYRSATSPGFFPRCASTSIPRVGLNAAASIAAAHRDSTLSLFRAD
jgi:carboxyl-terminal processing protease